MQLNLEDLDGQIRLFQTQAAEYLATIPDLDQEELDELVTDRLSDQAGRLANDGADFDEAQSAAEAAASGINNRGRTDQIACLMALGLGVEALEDALRKPSGPELG